MDSTKKPRALILGRNAGLAALFARTLRTRAIDIVFDDPDTNVITYANSRSEGRAGHVGEYRLRRADAPPVDQIFKIAGRPSPQALALTDEQRYSHWSHVYGEWCGRQSAAQRPFQSINVIACMDTRFTRPSDNDVRRMLYAMGATAQRMASLLNGTQVLCVAVDVDPMTDWQDIPSDYDREVAKLLQHAIDAQAALRQIQPFHGFRIVRQPDGRPHVLED